MKVVLAPGPFAGTCTAAEAATAIAEGWRRVRPGDDAVRAPLTGGGEGTLAVVAAAVPGCEPVAAEVADARGIATAATWLRLPDGRALIETAQACGLHRLAEDQRDPLRATTYGVGQLLGDAAASGAGELLVGLGDGAAVDGGAGMATALGHRLLRADGNGVKVGTAWLGDLVRIEPAARPGSPVRAAVDPVPLLGAGGAAAAGVARGADAEDVAGLEAALAVLADVAERDLPGGPWRDLPGAGADGGLGFGLAAFCGAELLPGVALVAELTGFPEALDGADLVVTGAGGPSSVPGHVGALAADRGVAVRVVDGAVRRVEDLADAAEALAREAA